MFCAVSFLFWFCSSSLVLSFLFLFLLFSSLLSFLFFPFLVCSVIFFSFVFFYVMLFFESSTTDFFKQACLGPDFFCHALVRPVWFSPACAWELPSTWRSSVLLEPIPCPNGICFAALQATTTTMGIAYGHRLWASPMGIAQATTTTTMGSPIDYGLSKPLRPRSEETPTTMGIAYGAIVRWWGLFVADYWSYAMHCY